MTDEQLNLLPKLDPDDVIRKAKEDHNPVATYCLFSGGSDSLVLAHRLRDDYDELVHFDTGTAVPGVMEFVKDFAANVVKKPLRILTPRVDDAFRLLVLGGYDWKGDYWKPHGFPGAAQHGRAYNRLKQDQQRELLRIGKEGHGPRARVLAITGVRRAESARRAKAAVERRDGSMVFSNPLIDWTNTDMASYRRDNNLELSDPAALLHRSGECNCGSFAAPGEREELMSLYPEWWNERIAPLEKEAEELGLNFCKWGGQPTRPDEVRPTACSAQELMLDNEEAGVLCSSCEHKIEAQLSLTQDQINKETE